MLARIIRSLSYANVIATLALVLAVGTGSSYAVAQLNGKTIKNRTVHGKKLQKDTVTGKEIAEHRLATVPRAEQATTAQTAGSALTAGNAGSVDGIDGGALVQGNVNVTAGRVTLEASDGVHTLATPIGEFRLRCPAANTDVRYVNTTGQGADLWRTSIRDGGNTSSLFGAVAPNADAGLAFPGPAQHVLRAEQGNRIAELSAHALRVDANSCRFAWTLTVQR